MKAPSLGTARFQSRAGRHAVSDDIRIPEHIEVGTHTGLQFELAGPRANLFFDGKNARAGIVTCGGLCPGLNNVIRSLFQELHYGYGVSEVLGFRGGYSGLDPDCASEPATITPNFVDCIHEQGGTVLGTSRGPIDVTRAVDNVMARSINMLFTVGGDGTQRGANELYQEARKRGHALAVVGVPKTIDNDVPFVSRTFGFTSAVEEAKRVLRCAHTEARSVAHGVSLVKLMGRHAGFVTAAAVVANQDVNFALIPEVPFKLETFLAALKKRLRTKSDKSDRDASGNVKLRDIGLFLREKIDSYFKGESMPVVLRYFDPSYQVRSCPANSEDALLCDLYARHAVHAAMAGKTGIVIGFLHECFIHVPIELLANKTKRLNPTTGWWHAVLAATGQPDRFE
jgi:6-phosphofructokinase 1